MAQKQQIAIEIKAIDQFSSEMKSLESQLLQAEQAGKKTSTAVAGLFHSLDNEHFSIQATWQQAMNDVKASTKKAIDDANKEIASLGKNVSSDRLAGPLKDLGIKSSLDIEKEKARAIAAFEAIKKSGVASADEIKRAQNALKERLESIDGAVAGSGAKLKTGLAGIASMLAGAFAVDRIVAFVRASFDASLAVESITSKLKVMTGSSDGAAKEWAFIRAEAKRLGLDLRETADVYAAFAVATKGTSMEGEKTRRMFTSVAEAATALHLPAEQTTRVLYQFQQMVSKGRVNMEDLKTAAESFPGLLGMVAKSLNITTAELMKQMEQGQLLSAEVLPKLADELHKTYGKAAEEAATKGRGAINRFKSDAFEMMQQLGSSVAPAIIWIGARFMNITKAIVGGWQLLAVTVGYTFDYIKTRMDKTLSKEATQTRLAQIGQAYQEQTAEISKNYGEAQKTISKAEADSAAKSVENNQRRRNEAKKTGADLAKVNVEYAKLTGDADAQLTAELEKQFEERKKAAKDYYDQKKAYAENDGMEAAYESMKKAKLLEIERQHKRDVEIVQAQARADKLKDLKDEIALETLLIQEKVAKGLMTEADGQRRITELTVAAAKTQYEAKKAVADKIADIYGKDGEEYKKALKDQESAHKEYLSSNLSAYKAYSGNIKKLDQEIADFRLGIQQKIADLQQRSMTEGQKYADNQKRFDEAVAKSRAALAAKDYENAQKYAKQAEELATRLADKKAADNTRLQDLERQHQERLSQIGQQGGDKQTDQQKQAAEVARENAAYEKERLKILADQQATTEGITNATTALNTVEQLGVSILEAKKRENQDALDKLKEIQAMKLDPKNLAVNLDEGALSAVKAEIDKLTATATKTINVVYKSTGAAGEDSFSNVPGMKSGGWVGGAGVGDTQLRMLDPREFVLRPEQASTLPRDFLLALNRPGARLQDIVSAYLPALNMPALKSAPIQPNVTPMGSLSLEIGGGSYAVQAPVDVLSELNTALRRRKMTRPQ